MIKGMYILGGYLAFGFGRQVVSLECFTSCIADSLGNCDGSGFSECEGKCGQITPEAGYTQNLPGVITVGCTEPEDTCLWAETEFERSNGRRFTIALPFGCKSSFKPSLVQNNIANNFKFAEGTNLFMCAGEFCNQPPEKLECFVEDARHFAEESIVNESSNCFVKEGPRVEPGLFGSLRSNFFRFLNNAQGVAPDINYLNHCIDLTAEEVSGLSLQKLNPADVEATVPLVTCETCLNTAGCDINEDIDLNLFVPPTRAPSSEPENEPVSDDEPSVTITAAIVVTILLIILVAMYTVRSTWKPKEVIDAIPIHDKPQSEVIVNHFLTEAVPVSTRERDRTEVDLADLNRVERSGTANSTAFDIKGRSEIKTYEVDANKKVSLYTDP